MIEALQNAFRLPDLRRKMLYTLLILIVYQFAAHVTVPGVDRAALDELFSGDEAGFLNVLNLLSGGAVSNFSVIANGVYPYITASIILQLLIPIIPALEAIQKEPGGQEKIGRYTYYLAIPMAALQSVGQINIFQNQINQTSTGITLIDGFGFGAGSDLLTTASVVLTMTAGTMFAIWLGELITEQGIGNGISIIIFAGIVARVPSNLYQLMQGDGALFNLIAFVVLTIFTVVVIVIIQEGQRRIPVQYGKRVRGRKLYGGGATHIPLKVNTAGMIPLIFAQSIVTFPAIVAGFFSGSLATQIQDMFGNQDGFLYWFIYFWLVVGFTYFYTGVMIQNQNLGENLQKNGGFIPGIRPGRRTQEYINRIVNRITLVGAVFLGAVAILPGVMQVVQEAVLGPASAGGSRNPALVISSAGLIIVVGVVIDTMRQLEAQLTMRNYDGFMR